MKTQTHTGSQMATSHQFTHRCFKQIIKCLNMLLTDYLQLILMSVVGSKIPYCLRFLYIYVNKGVDSIQLLGMHKLAKIA